MCTVCPKLNNYGVEFTGFTCYDPWYDSCLHSRGVMAGEYGERMCAMIHGISPQDPQDPTRREKKDSAAAKEPDTALPVDSATLGQPKGKASAEEFRKASIEYYPLHVRDRAESAPYTTSASPSTDEKNKAKPSVTTPKYIPLFREAPGLSGLTEQSGLDVGPFERKLATELGSLARVQNEWDIEALQGEVPTVSKLKDMFNKVADDKSVPWEYLVDGCYARAHVTAEKFLNEGMSCAKLYVITGDPGPGDQGYPFPGWSLGASNKFTEGRWWYHVATLVFAKDDKTGDVDGYIIDRAVNRDRPLGASEWIRAVWPGNFPIRFDTTHADIYDPPNQDYFPEPQEFSRERFDKFIPEARETNKEYSQTLKAIKDNYYAHHPEEKPENEA
jgi:hypothetical protein